MTYLLRFLPEVEEDVFNGYAWYEEKAPGLGEEFMRMFHSCIAEIARNPFQYMIIEGEFRRCLMRRFPYAVYFRVNDNQIIVCGSFHCAREPLRIQIQLQNRNDPRMS